MANIGEIIGYGYNVVYDDEVGYGYGDYDGYGVIGGDGGVDVEGRWRV